MRAFNELTKDADHCRLASLGLVDRFNALGHFFDRIQTELPEVVEHQRFRELWEKLWQRLDKLRLDVALNHYQVGFLGLSQIGKSTTFNNVLGINKKLCGEAEYQRIAPAVEGSLGAMTATVTRLRCADVNGNVNVCRVKYLSQAEHERRRERVFRELKLPKDLPIDQAINEIGRQVEMDAERMRQTSSSEAEHEEEQLTSEDRERVKKYLQAVHEYEEQIQGGESTVVSYADRGAYINHEIGQPVSQKWLQSEVELEFCTDAISRELEMIDLPGLGSTFWDDVLTGEFLPKLNAVLVFHVVSKNVDDGQFRVTMKRLNRHFQNNLCGRVWIIILHIESLSEVTLYGNSQDRRTLLDNLSPAIASKNVPLNQVLVISNNWYSEHVQKDESGTAVCQIPTSKFTGFPWKFKLDQTGQLVPPEEWRDHPELSAAFCQAMKDGGISALRKLLKETIAQEVKVQFEKTINEDLDRLKRDLKDRLSDMRTFLDLNDEDLTAANLGATVVTGLADDLRWNPKYSDDPARKLWIALQSSFDRLCPKGHRVRSDKIHEEHRDWVRELARTVQTGLKIDLFPALFQSAKIYLNDNLPERAKNLLIRSGDRDQRLTPLKAWDHFCELDIEKGKLEQPLVEQLVNSQLFSPDNQHRTFDSIPDYRDHMHCRLKTLVHEATHQCLLRMRQRLASMKEQLRFLSREGENEGPSGTSGIAEGISDSVKGKLEMILQALPV